MNCSNNNVEEKIKELCIGNGIDYDNISNCSNEIDSIQYISTLLAIEDEFEICFPDYVLENNVFEDIDGLITIVKECLHEKSSN